MGSLGPFEIMLVFLVILLVFGAKRIPEIARGLGKGIREFKDATKEISNELNVNLDERPRIQTPRSPAQGTTAPRTDYQQAQPEPPQPERADNPGAEARPQQTQQ
jgi:sec-independent protein translocase protein TatA